MPEPFSAERLNQLVPGNFPKKTIFVTTGADAVENAVKIARHHTKRSAVIAFAGGFHGRTFMGMALTGRASPLPAIIMAVTSLTKFGARSETTGGISSVLVTLAGTST